MEEQNQYEIYTGIIQAELDRIRTLSKEAVHLGNYEMAEELLRGDMYQILFCRYSVGKGMQSYIMEMLNLSTTQEKEKPILEEMVRIFSGGTEEIKKELLNWDRKVNKIMVELKALNNEEE